MSRALNVAFGTIGLAAIAIAVAAAVAPGEPEGFVPIQPLIEATPISEDSTRAIGFAIGGLLCAVWVTWTAGTNRSKRLSAGSLSATDIGFRTLRENPPENTAAGAVVGKQFDKAVVTAANNASNGDESDPIRENVRSLAVSVVAHTEGCSESEAEAIVETGEWTDDAVAAAYVTDSEAELSLRHRIFAWLRPSRTKRGRVERAIRAIDRHERRVD
ncbi:MAG: hypothetical protein V5A36_00140 [Natronomonas sp.]